MKCSRCGADDRRIELHHKQAKVLGGSDELFNLQPLCIPCHRYMNARLSIELALNRYQRQLAEHTRGGWRSQESADQYYVEKIKQYEWRLRKLDELNTPERIRERGNHESYFSHERSSWNR